ncbi:MAG TPA: response regulator [Smithellaceae bacterium]|nr:response regulator [Smithellaceae bacterium]
MKIILADDNNDNLYLLEQLLAGHDMEVTTARNGAEALQKAVAAPPDLIITDILMPVMDGFSLCREWMSDEKLRHIPLIFYTATYTEPQDEAFALSLGAKRFIIKPQEPEIFLKAINDVLRQKQEATPETERPLGEEMEFFRQYNEILFNKLEKKIVALNKVNHELQKEITEHKKAEEKLLKLTHAIEESPVSIIITDLQGNIEYVNPNLCRTSGYSAEEVVGRKFHIFQYSENNPPEIYNKICETITGGNVWQGELCNRRKTGELYWEYMSISPVKNSQGVITHFMAIAEDVSERQKLEEQLRQSQKLEGIGQLAGGVAHDFNNILTAIIGYAHLAMIKMNEDDPARHYLKLILESSEKATILTQSLLAFSRKQTVNLTTVNLNTLVANFQKFLLRILREDIELQTKLTKKPLPVMVYRGQLEQVLMNLVTNARDAMPKGGRLIIETELVEIDREFVRVYGYGEPGMYALLSASDNGIGMDAKTKEKIFEPFFTTKEQGKGTGLGLATVYGIVKKHQGHINVYSEKSKGTTLRILLPITTTAIDDEKNLNKPAIIKGGTETILLAEDNPEIRELISTILTNHGYQIIAAADGEEAIDKLSENKDKIKLVLLDVIMPKKNGKEVFFAIRMIKPQMKTIFMSGYSAEIINHQELDNTNASYLQKPVMPSDLLVKVREALDS